MIAFCPRGAMALTRLSTHVLARSWGVERWAKLAKPLRAFKLKSSSAPPTYPKYWSWAAAGNESTKNRTNAASLFMTRSFLWMIATRRGGAARQNVSARPKTPCFAVFVRASRPECPCKHSTSEPFLLAETAKPHRTRWMPMPRGGGAGPRPSPRAGPAREPEILVVGEGPAPELGFPLFKEKPPTASTAQRWRYCLF